MRKILGLLCFIGALVAFGVAYISLEYQGQRSMGRGGWTQESFDRAVERTGGYSHPYDPTKDGPDPLAQQAYELQQRNQFGGVTNISATGGESHTRFYIIGNNNNWDSQTYPSGDNPTLFDSRAEAQSLADSLSSGSGEGLRWEVSSCSESCAAKIENAWRLAHPGQQRTQSLQPQLSGLSVRLEEKEIPVRILVRGGVINTIHSLAVGERRGTKYVRADANIPGYGYWLETRNNGNLWGVSIPMYVALETEYRSVPGNPSVPALNGPSPSTGTAHSNELTTCPAGASHPNPELQTIGERQRLAFKAECILDNPLVKAYSDCPARFSFDKPGRCIAELDKCPSGWEDVWDDDARYMWCFQK